MNQSMEEQLKALGLKKKSRQPKAKSANKNRKDQQNSAPANKPKPSRRKKRVKVAKKMPGRILTGLTESSASAVSSEAIRMAYGNAKKTATNSTPTTTTTTSAPAKPWLEFPGSLRSPWQHTQGTIEIAMPKNPGIAQSLDFSGDYDNIDQINVGFDFGTSAIKVMLRTSDDNVLPVKFTSNADNPYILPSCLYIADGHASLQPSPGAQAFQDLKLPLLKNPKDENAVVRAAIFLALALRMVRGWLFDNYGEIFTGKYLVWDINFGVPAAVHDKKGALNSFKDLFELACLVSRSNSKRIGIKKVKEQWRAKAWEHEREQSLRQHQLNVIPEIAAQIFGLINSDSWDRSNRLMSVVDIGAGTVDVGVFSITGRYPDQRLHFLKTSVKPNGVVNLHRFRIQKMLEAESNASQTVRDYLIGMQDVTDINRPIPETWEGYLPGSRLVRGSFNPDQQFDTGFYSPQVTRLLNTVKFRRYKNPDDWRALPVLICGGGGSEGLYAQLFQRTSGSRVTSGIGFKTVPLITPQKVRASGLKDRTYRRMSLAYGLSFSFDLYPDLVEESEISDFKANRGRVQQVEMVTKDCV